MEQHEGDCLYDATRANTARQKKLIFGVAIVVVLIIIIGLHFNLCTLLIELVVSVTAKK